MAFDRNTLGMKATHSGHNFNKRKGWYETTVQDIGYKAGHSVILGNEPQEIFRKKFPDGTWDGKRFEIAAAETGTSNNIRSALSHCASKPDSEVAVIFMPNGHDPKNIRAGIGKYEGLSPIQKNGACILHIWRIDNIRLQPEMNRAVGRVGEGLLKLTQLLHYKYRKHIKNFKYFDDSLPPRPRSRDVSA